MVLPVVDDPNLESLTPEFDSEFRVAKMTDRFLATVFDSALVFPFFFFLMAPILQEITKGQIFGADPRETGFYFLIAAFEVFVLGTLYQAFCWSRYQATFGERILKIEVRAFTGEPLSFWRAYLRSVCWWVQLCLMGVPFLEVVAHPKRLGFHDRLTETWVATKKSGFLEVPGEPERNLVQIIYKLCFSVFAFWTVTLSWHFFDAAKDRKWTEASLEEKGHLCERVSEQLGANGEIKFHDRIERALALYAAKNIDEECLQKEAEYSVWKNESAEAYLALSFANKSDSQKSDEYLAKVCDANDESEACSVAKLMGEESSGDWSEVNDESVAYKKLWALPFLIRDQKIKLAEEIIETLAGDPAFGPYLADKRMNMSLQIGDNEKARGIFLGSQSFLSLIQQMEMLTDLCSQLRQKSCLVKTTREEQSCTWLKKLAQGLDEKEAEKVSAILDRPVNCLGRMPADEESAL